MRMFRRAEGGAVSLVYSAIGGRRDSLRVSFLCSSSSISSNPSPLILLLLLLPVPLTLPPPTAKAQSSPPSIPEEASTKNLLSIKMADLYLFQRAESRVVLLVYIAIGST